MFYSKNFSLGGFKNLCFATDFLLLPLLTHVALLSRAGNAEKLILIYSKFFGDILEYATVHLCAALLLEFIIRKKSSAHRLPRDTIDNLTPAIDAFLHFFVEGFQA
jgi:hypothetical protein